VRMDIMGLHIRVTQHPEDGYVTIESENDFTIIAPGGINIIGDVKVNGNITASGSIIDAAGNTNHHSH